MVEHASCFWSNYIVRTNCALNDRAHHIIFMLGFEPTAPDLAVKKAFLLSFFIVYHLLLVIKQLVYESYFRRYACQYSCAHYTYRKHRVFLR